MGYLRRLCILVEKNRDFSHCTLHASTNDHLVLLLAYNDAGNGKRTLLIVRVPQHQLLACQCETDQKIRCPI
jgi:hypothetical protein